MPINSLCYQNSGCLGRGWGGQGLVTPVQHQQHTRFQPFQAAGRGHQHQRKRVTLQAAEDPQQTSKEGEKPTLPTIPSPPPIDDPNLETAQPQPPVSEQQLQLPKEVIERIKFTVFGFDTFWVTSVENYETNGVIFKGNVRGKDPAVSYQKIKERMKAELGDAYSVFLLADQDDKPTVVVLPQGAGGDSQVSKVAEIWLATLFAICTTLTTLNACGLPLTDYVFDPFTTKITQQDVLDTLPAAAAFWFILGSHDFGHYQAAARHNVKISLPFIIPAGFGFVGSFGSLMRVKGFLPNRDAQLDMGMSGPLLGTGVSLACVLLGFILSAAGQGDLAIESPAFLDSLGMAILAQVFLGDQLLQPEVQINFLLIAGWAGLIANSLNLIPAGELDGNRIALAIWGRRTANTAGAITTVALGLSAFNSSLSAIWVLLVLILQRGPLLPCFEEMSAPKDERKVQLGAALLAAPLFTLLPYPAELLLAMQDAINNPDLTSYAF